MDGPESDDDGSGDEDGMVFNFGEIEVPNAPVLNANLTGLADPKFERFQKVAN